VKCMECGRELVSVTTTHLRVCCGLTVAEYRAKHSDAPTYDSEYIRKLSREERRQRRAEYKLRWQQSHPKNYRQSMRKWELANPDRVNARAKSGTLTIQIRLSKKLNAFTFVVLESLSKIISKFLRRKTAFVQFVVDRKPARIVNILMLTIVMQVAKSEVCFAIYVTLDLVR
jgi:hypothetical protein